MNNFTLDTKSYVASIETSNLPTKVQSITQTSINDGSIMDRLVNFAKTVPDFPRIGTGNYRQNLGDIIILMILARMSGCVARADIIEFGRHNIKKFQSMRMLKRCVPSRCR